MLLTPTATISGLTAGASYALLRFDTPGAVPANGDFLSAVAAVRVNFVAAASTVTMQLAQIMSNSTAFYRCVRTSA